MIEIEFLGTYQTGRAPCEWLPNCSRRWARATGFNGSSLIKGDFKVAYIEIAPDWDQNSDVQLQEGAPYKVNIAMSMERFRALKLGDEQTIMIVQDPIFKNEITGIEKNPSRLFTLKPII